jgi:serine/threonine protein kinase/tetratricopeptide (TPR) repeat protein
MGVVYLAKDTKLGRAVALKFLPPQWCHDEGAKQRFLREAQAASATNHKNICIIHDIEETEDGQLFIVMAHYEGPTLKRTLEGGALPWAEALEIAGEIAEGLAKAHAHGVVHRDIKPGNIIVTEDGIKILDFGLAKLADAALKLTLEGSTLGTVAYMSPEQAKGEDADERSDIWAVGVVLYEMLTGEVPFKGTYSEAIFYAIKNEDPAPLGAKAKDLPDGVEPIVRRALAKDPAERYQSARDLAREIRFLQGRSLPFDLRTEAVRVPTSISAPPRKRRPLAWITAAAAVLALAAGGAYAWLARPLARLPISIVPVSNHTGDLQFDAYRLALTQSLIAELEDSPNLRVFPYPRLLETLGQFFTGKSDPSSSEAIQLLAAQSGASLLIVPSIEYDKDGAWKARAYIRNPATATNVAEVATSAETSSLPRETVHRQMQSLARAVQAHFKLRWPHRAFERHADGRFLTLEAARAFSDGVTANEQLEYAAARDAFLRAVKQDPQRALAHAWLSRTLLVIGDTQNAVAAGREANRLMTANTPRADALFAAATLAEAQSDFTKAEQAYRSLAALHPDDPAVAAELADYLKRQSRNEEAVDAYLEALRRDPGTARAHVDLCQLYSRLDNYPLSEEHAQTALTTFRSLGNRGGEAQALLCYGDELLQQGNRIAEARKHIEAARDIFASLGLEYGSSRVYQYLGYLAGREHNYPAAAEAFAEAVSRSRKLGNRQIEGLGLMNLGVSYQMMGKIPDAVAYFDQSRQVYQEVGDQRRAAEQDVNAAGLEVNYGGKIDAALRRLANARVALHKLGYVDFEVSAMLGQAQGELAAGRMTESLRLLREGSSVATERQLKRHLDELKMAMATVEMFRGNYDAARQTVEPLIAGEDTTPEARIILGRAYLRMGDFAAAQQQLNQAASDAHRTGELGLAGLVDAALGELNYESGNSREALERYRRVAALDNRSVPNGAVAEAGCRMLALDESKAAIESDRAPRCLANIATARAAGQRLLAESCSLEAARFQLQRHRYDAALDALSQVRSDSSFSPGAELEALAHYWRSVALEGLGDTARSKEERARAKALALQIQTALPEKYRQTFGSRVSIRPLLE